VGVRIGVARLVSAVCDEHFRRSVPVGEVVEGVRRRLLSDWSHEVQSYIRDRDPSNGYPSRYGGELFSRPPHR